MPDGSEESGEDESFDSYDISKEVRMHNFWMVTSNMQEMIVARMMTLSSVTPRMKSQLWKPLQR
jgi:hypothetical protein